MSIRIVWLLMLLSALGAVRVSAQTPEPAAAEAVRTLTVDPQPFDAEAPTGAAVRLLLVAEVVNVPLVLEQASATADNAVAQVQIRSTASAQLSQVVLAVTAVRLAGGTPVRRTIPVVVSLLPGETKAVDVVGVRAVDLAAVWAAGEVGALEVAVVGVTGLDGSAVNGDLGPPAFLPVDTVLACGDATWQQTAAGDTAADPSSGQVLECDRHGLWRIPIAEDVQ